MKTKEILFDDFLKQISAFFDMDSVNSLAKECKFVQRESEITGHIFMTTFIFGMNIYGNPTLEQLTSLLNSSLPNVSITRQSFHERINEKAVTFFEFLLNRAFQIHVPKEFDLEILAGFKEIILLDSTGFQLPEELAELFPGFGGGASAAGVKIQFGYDIKSSRFFYKIHAARSPDNSYSNSFVEELNPGDLRITDLGYATSQAFNEIDIREAYYLSRGKSDCPFYQKNEEGEFEKFDLINFIRGIKKPIEETRVYIKSGDNYHQTRLVIEPVPASVKEQRLRRLAKEAKKKGRKTKEKTKILQGFSLYISNAPENLLPACYFRILYGVRWQVELIFKSWKSNLMIDDIKVSRKERVLCSIYAKLIFIFITHKISFLARNFAWIKSHREISVFRAVKHLKSVASNWYKKLVQGEEINKSLKNSFDFMVRHFFKSKQKDRVYPLEIMEWLEYHQNLNPAANHGDYAIFSKKHNSEMIDFTMK